MLSPSALLAPLVGRVRGRGDDVVVFPGGVAELGGEIRVRDSVLELLEVGVAVGHRRSDRHRGCDPYAPGDFGVVAVNVDPLEVLAEVVAGGLGEAEPGGGGGVGVVGAEASGAGVVPHQLVLRHGR